MKIIVLTSAAMVLLSSSSSSVASAALTKKQQLLLKQRNSHQALFLKDLPNAGGEWQTLENGVEVQPASNLSPLAQEHLRRLTWGKSSGSSSMENDANGMTTIYKDGTETYYDEYSQAWRALGFYIDCDADVQEDGRRQLEDDNNDGITCQRYMLWAAYVDEEYSGHGVGEYKYYDRKSNRWSDYACQKFNNTERCVPMDCHLPNTHFSLIGFFKEPNYGEWMEQLFKHEGDCVWTDEEFQFMQGDRDAWPEECGATGLTTSSGSTLYYDLKPALYGSYDIGLYTESACIEEYTGDEYTAKDVVGGDDGGDDGGDLYDDLATWNSAFDVFKQCQPCKAYMLTDIVAGMGYAANADGNRYGDADANNNGGRLRKLQDGEDGEDEEFRCHDAAGYDSVNQCMKFKTKTRMMTASWQDVMLAGAQGTIAQVVVPGFYSSAAQSYNFNTQKFGATSRNQGITNGSPVGYFLYLTVAVLFFTVSFLRCMVVFNDTRKTKEIMEPLVENTEAVTA